MRHEAWSMKHVYWKHWNHIVFLDASEESKWRKKNQQHKIKSYILGAVCVCACVRENLLVDMMSICCLPRKKGMFNIRSMRCLCLSKSISYMCVWATYWSDRKRFLHQSNGFRYIDQCRIRYISGKEAFVLVSMILLFQSFFFWTDSISVHLLCRRI